MCARPGSMAVAALVVWVGAASIARGARAAGSGDGYEHALKLRAELEARPERTRTRHAYEPVLAAYRAVYHGNPASPHADASVEAVAELLEEESGVLRDPKAALDAIGQYEFLRREYPGSRYGPGALLAEGELYRRAVKDAAAAQATFKAFLREYPHHPLAAQARAELKAAGSGRGVDREPAVRATAGREPAASQGRHNAVLDAALASQNALPPSQKQRPALTRPPATGQTAASHGPAAPAAVSAGASSGIEEHDLPAGPGASPAPGAPQPAAPVSALSPVTAPSGAAGIRPVAHSSKNGQLPMITGVRHWSTPVYTRVAIDLSSDADEPVQYEAARVPNPERIFFDLHGVRLSPELLGRAVQVSTPVTDDGYLKRIRAAQFSGDVVRVVLDVSDVSDYSAFFLPNPWRLIIDIHGRAPGSLVRYAAAPAAAADRAPAQSTSAANSSGTPLAGAAGRVPTPSSAQPLPQAAAQTPAPLTREARSGVTPPPPTTPVTTKQQTEIAALDQQPDRVKATRKPTTAPVAASVPDTTPAPQPNAALATATRRSRPREPAAERGDDAAAGRIARPTAGGERSMVRALGLKIGRIVVDAGHGGHDSGTLGPGGIEEKTVVLDVALRLGRLLKQRLGADVIYTRDDDTFLPLETRTAIANKAQADLFLSVHANSSQDASARGVETYYLNFTTSADALEVAARENAVSDQSIHQLSDLVRKITLQDKIAESKEFAADVDQSLYSGLEAGNAGLKDRGVKKAPFVVLIGANMPSILAEISFLTNPDDAHQLSDPEYRQRIAEALYRGVARYVSSLSGVRLASGPGRPTGE